MKPALLLSVLLSALCATAWAQETVAPTVGETTLPPRGEDAGNYNVVQSWELGYRFATIGGDEGKYRSDVNFGNGVRLLSSYLTINSRDGHGSWFDEISLTTQGLGNDPYESATLRVQKNRLYRYDMLWRLNDYFNPGLTVADGQHLEDTTYQWQDHDVTLFPQSWFRVRAGYSRTTQEGPALTTQQEFETNASNGELSTLFRNTRQQYNEYRLGADLTLKSFRFTVQHRWEYFKDDTEDTNTPGSEPLTFFDRAQPYRGRTPGWLVNLYGERKWVAADGRFTYAGGRGDFVQNELARGIDTSGNLQNRQIVVTGNGDRPVINGDLNITLFPSSRLSLINETSVSNTRITGDNSYEQFNNATLAVQTLNFQFLGVRLITNATDLRYRFSRRFDVSAGFRYADREVRSIEDSAALGSPFSGLTGEQSDLLRAGIAALNWMPIQDLRVHLETEIGRNNNPFTPIGLRNYHVIRSRVVYRKETPIRSSGSYQENYNNNLDRDHVLQFACPGNYTGQASWSAKPWLSIDASYSKLHLDTVGGLAFFAAGSFITNEQSIYISNIHAASLGLRMPVTKRADLYLGYNITKDTGDGRSSNVLTGSSPTAQLLYSVQTFPLTYQTPLVRLSVKITDKIRYNLGYQYYGYHEDFGVLSENQNYRAHTGYTSLLWSF